MLIKMKSTGLAADSQRSEENMVFVLLKGKRILKKMKWKILICELEMRVVAPVGDGWWPAFQTLVVVAVWHRPAVAAGCTCVLTQREGVSTGPYVLELWSQMGHLQRYGKEKKYFLPPWTLGRVHFSSLNFKTSRPASSDSQNRLHDLLERFWEQFYYFSFIFILTESLKNHSKLQKIIK